MRNNWEALRDASGFPIYVTRGQTKTREPLHISFYSINMAKVSQAPFSSTTIVSTSNVQLLPFTLFDKELYLYVTKNYFDDICCTL